MKNGIHIDADTRVTSTQLSFVLKLTRQRINQIAADGIISKGADGMFNLADAVEAWTQWKIDRSTEVTKQSHTDRLKDAKALEIERKLAIQERKIIPLTEAQEIFDLVTGSFLTSLGSLPARITRVKRERQRIEVIIDAVRTRLSEEFDKRRHHLETGVDPDGAGGEADA